MDRLNTQHEEPMTTNSNRTLLIDDVRTLKAHRIARTYDEGIKALTEESWDILLLDHDLGCFDENGREWTGYDILCFLEENRSNKSMQNYATSANCLHLNSCFIDRHCSVKNCNLPSL